MNYIESRDDMSFHKLPTKHVNELSLNVSDLERSLSFYEHVLGFSILNKKANQATMTVDGETPILNLIQPENVRQLNARKTGLYHAAYLLPSRSDLADFLLFAIENRIPLQGASDHGVSEAIYLADPDGNGIEIYSDRQEEEWEWQNNRVHMITEALQADHLVQDKSDDGWLGAPKETVIGHVHLQVHNLEQIQKFYVNYFDFNVVLNYGAHALFISDNNYHHHIGLNVWNSMNGAKKEADEVGLNWYSIKMTEDDRQVVKDKLIKANIQVEEQAGRYIVEDPAGITIRF